MQISEQLDAFIRATIDQKREQKGATDVLAALVQAHDEDGMKLSDDELIGHAFTLFVAGHETTSQDYNFITSNHTKTFLEPRGLDALLQKLQKADWPYAVTSSLATRPLGAIAPPRLAALYVPNSTQAAEDLHLHKAERGANVLLVEPFDPVVFERTTQVDGIVYTAVTQTAADLLTSSGRGPEEAEWVLQWMEEHEDAWRA